MSVIELNVWIPWMSTRTGREENVWNLEGFKYTCHSTAWRGDDWWFSWESSDGWLISCPLSSARYLHGWRTLLETGRTSTVDRAVHSTGRSSQKNFLVQTLDKSYSHCWEPQSATHMRHICHLRGRLKCALGSNGRGMKSPHTSVIPNFINSSACLLHYTPVREEEFKKKEVGNLVEIN